MSFEPTPSPEDRSDDGSTGRTGPFPAGRPDATASSNDEPIRTLLWTAATHRPLDEVAALVSLLNRTGELSRPGDEALRAAAVARPLEEVRQLVTLLNETPHDTGEAGTTLRAAAMGRSIEDVAELVAILGMDHGTRSGTGSMTVPGAESGNQPRPESGTEPRPESTTEATEADTGTEAPFGTEPAGAAEHTVRHGAARAAQHAVRHGATSAPQYGVRPGVRRGPPRAVRRGRAVGGRSFPRLSPRLRRTPRRPRHHPLRHG